MSKKQDTMRVVNVKGKCPACGSRALFVGKGGYVTCSLIGCPNPSAPSEELNCNGATDAAQSADKKLEELP